MQNSIKDANLLASHPKVSIYIATSIDGYIARKDGNLDWLQYGHVGDEDYDFKKFIDSIDAVILGGNTYRVVSEFEEWPYKNKRVVVLSRTLKNVGKEAELFYGRPSDLLSKLHSENVRHVWVDGGMTVSGFLQAGLADEMTVSVIPMILGSGIPLFSRMNQELECRLEGSRA